MVDAYKQLDEEAAKSGMEKPWNCYLSLYVLGERVSVRIVERQPIVLKTRNLWCW